MKRIIFKGLGPTGNVTHEGQIIKDGAIIEVEDNIAEAYIKLGIAYEVTDELDAIKLQEKIKKDEATRKKVIEAASKERGGKK